MKLKGENWRMAKRQRLYYRRRLRTNKDQQMFEPVQAYPLQVAGWEYLELFVLYEKRPRGWIICETTTGEQLNGGKTMDEAIEELLRRLAHYGQETVDKKIAEILAQGVEYHSPLYSAAFMIDQLCNCVRDTVEAYMRDAAERRKAEYAGTPDPSMIPYRIHPWESVSLQNAIIDMQPVKVGNPAMLTLYIEIKER